MTADLAAILRITDDSTRPEIAASIAALMRKRERLPVHWLDQRAEIMDEIDALVDQWLKARA